MARLHLFECQDLDWFPQHLRNLLTDVLWAYITLCRPYSPIVPRLRQILEKTKDHQMIDLCSGSGGPIRYVQQKLESQENYPVQVVLTDKYPNITSFQKRSHESSGKIRYVEKSVDATNVPTTLKGFRTSFSSFHHFQPDMAQKILADAAQKKLGIGVFEFTDRSFILIFAMLLLPIFIFAVTPFLRPFRWSRIFLTYLIPIIPILSTWDGMVSNLRTYSVKELRELTQKIQVPNYSWEIGQAWSLGGYKITYLYGYPLGKEGRTGT